MTVLDERADGAAPITVQWVRGARAPVMWRADLHGVVLLVSKSAFGHWVPELSWAGGIRVRGPHCATKTTARNWCTDYLVVCRDHRRRGRRRRHPAAPPVSAETNKPRPDPTPAGLSLCWEG